MKALSDRQHRSSAQHLSNSRRRAAAAAAAAAPAEAAPHLQARPAGVLIEQRQRLLGPQQARQAGEGCR
jgi:hypothetical protein